MEIVIGIIAIAIIIIVAGKLIGPPDPSTLSVEQLVKRMQSTNTWITKYHQLPFDNQQGEGIKKQYNEKKAYLQKLTLEFQKLTSEEETEEDKKEREIVTLISNLFETKIGLPKVNALDASMNIVSEELSNFPSGSNPYKSTRGNELVEREGFIEPRIESGLTKQEIIAFWNRPLLLIACETKIFTFIQYTNIKTAEDQGKDIWEAAGNYKKYAPRFGDPQEWDVTEKQNIGLTENDAEIYVELSCRINNWMDKITVKEIDDLIEKYGTLNATISNLVKEGVISSNEECEANTTTSIFISHIIKYLASNGRLIS